MGTKESFYLSWVHVGYSLARFSTSNGTKICHPLEHWKKVRLSEQVIAPLDASQTFRWIRGPPIYDYMMALIKLQGKREGVGPAHDCGSNRSQRYMVMRLFTVRLDMTRLLLS